jgi:hypothetical protein
VGQGDWARGEPIVNIVAAFLAAGIEITPSGFDLEGAFPVSVNPPELPYTVDFPVGFVANLEPDEIGQTFRVVIATGPADEVLAYDKGQEWIFGRVTGEWGVPLYLLHQKVIHTITFTETGPHLTVIWGDVGVLATIPFYVRD